MTARTGKKGGLMNKSINIIAAMLSPIASSTEGAYKVAEYLVQHKCAELNKVMKEALEDAVYYDVTIGVADGKLNVSTFDGQCGESSDRWFNSRGILVYDYYDHGECCYGHRNKYDEDGNLISHAEWGD